MTTLTRIERVEAAEARGDIREVNRLLRQAETLAVQRYQDAQECPKNTRHALRGSKIMSKHQQGVFNAVSAFYTRSKL